MWSSLCTKSPQKIWRTNVCTWSAALGASHSKTPQPVTSAPPWILTQFRLTKEYSLESVSTASEATFCTSFPRANCLSLGFCPANERVDFRGCVGEFHLKLDTPDEEHDCYPEINCQLD